ncbi:MAG: hypothetical protein DWH82_01645 [Planctomycetota bacterium]|nr:MAG: hypothetical protein DWH82_01645 [Planctomycetota bacterium]
MCWSFFLKTGLVIPHGFLPGRLTRENLSSGKKHYGFLTGLAAGIGPRIINKEPLACLFAPPHRPCHGRSNLSNSRRPNQRSPDSTHINIIWGGINAMHGFWSGKQLLIYHREKR